MPLAAFDVSTQPATPTHSHHSYHPYQIHPSCTTPPPHRPTNPQTHKPIRSQGRARPLARTHARLAFQEGGATHVLLLSTEHSPRYAGVPNAAIVALAIARPFEAVMDANEYACVAPTPKEHARFGE